MFLCFSLINFIYLYYDYISRIICVYFWLLIKAFIIFIVILRLNHGPKPEININKVTDRMELLHKHKVKTVFKAAFQISQGQIEVSTFKKYVHNSLFVSVLWYIKHEIKHVGLNSNLVYGLVFSINQPQLRISIIQCTLHSFIAHPC